jgi:putative phage-type endonuclease
MAKTVFITTEHTREEWLAERRKGIGGSDSPVIVLGDRHPYSSPRELWEEKMGLREPRPATPAMERGTVLEPIIAKKYAEITGRKVRRVNRFVQNPYHPWMIGNIDREIATIPGRKGPGVLELKCPGIRAFTKIKREGIPAVYQIQLQHYIETEHRTWGSFGIFNADLWELLWLDVERNEEIIREILEKGEAFWECMLSGTPPEGGSDKLLILPDLPPVKGGTEIVRLDGDEWTAAVERYRMAREITAEAAELKEEAEAGIQSLMTVAGASVAEGAGARVYWQDRAGTRTFDHKAFAAAHPEQAEEMQKFYRQNKGSRPFSVYFLKEGGNGYDE